MQDIFAACESGDLESFQQILNSKQIDINCKDDYGIEFELLIGHH